MTGLILLELLFISSQLLTTFHGIDTIVLCDFYVTAILGIVIWQVMCTWNPLHWRNAMTSLPEHSRGAAMPHLFLLLRLVSHSRNFHSSSQSMVLLGKSSFTSWLDRVDSCRLSFSLVTLSGLLKFILFHHFRRMPPSYFVRTRHRAEGRDKMKFPAGLVAYMHVRKWSAVYSWTQGTQNCSTPSLHRRVKFAEVRFSGLAFLHLLLSRYAPALHVANWRYSVLLLFFFTLGEGNLSDESKILPWPR